MSENSPLKIKSFAFAVRIVNLCKYLVSQHREFVISKQLLKAGTNPGAMVREAFNAESDKDFLHKLGVGQKEISETIYWLELLFATDYITQEQFDSIQKDAVEVIKLIVSSINTKKKNMNR